MKKALLFISFLLFAGNLLGEELGFGSGSGYPAALDTDFSQETSTHIARSNVPNDLADAIVKIEAELGIDPAGTAATVNARIGLRSAARVYLSGVQTNLVHGVYTKILFDTESYDVGSNFNVTESTFTVPITGYYNISSCLTWTPTIANTEYIIVIMKNSIPIASAYYQAAMVGGQVTNVNDTVYLTAGDGIWIAGYNNHASDDNVDINATIYSWVNIRFLTQ